MELGALYRVPHCFFYVNVVRTIGQVDRMELDEIGQHGLEVLCEKQRVVANVLIVSVVYGLHIFESFTVTLLKHTYSSIKVT